MENQQLNNQNKPKQTTQAHKQHLCSQDVTKEHQKYKSQSKYANQTNKFHPKNLKHQLYNYQKVDLLKESQQSEQISQKDDNDLKRTQQYKKLDENLEQDRQIIMGRKKKIKEYGRVTRDWPNSSFTTYYGKPTFQVYGRGSSKCNLKSHNVMPHRGNNYPHQIQTHQNALIKGRSINVDNHVPRKPITATVKQTNQSRRKIIQVPTNLPLQTPDLINHVRFAQENDTKSKYTFYKTTLKSTKYNKKKAKRTIKPNKKRRIVQPIDDKLKYLNKRENLLCQLQQKKTRNSRLAYKVTQCYPLEWHCSNVCGQNDKLQKWNTTRVAGLALPQSDHMKDVLCTRKVTNC